MSRGVSRIAFRQLYRNLDVPSTSSDHSHFEATLNSLSQSRGIQYTRTVKIGHSKFINSNTHGHCTAMEAFIKSLPVDAVTRFEFGSYAWPAICGGYDLLWQSQRNLQNLQVDFEPANPNGPINPLKNYIRNLRKLSELEVDFGCTLPVVRLWLRDVMDGHDFSKIHFRYLRLSDPGEEEIEFLPLQDCLINGNPKTLTHLTLFDVYLPRSDTLTLDAFPCLVHLDAQEWFPLLPVLEAFQEPRLTHLLLRDTSTGMNKWSGLTKFLASFQTLKSIVIDLPELWMQPDNGGSLPQAIAHHARGLNLLYLQWEWIAESNVPWVARVPNICDKMQTVASIDANVECQGHC